MNNSTIVMICILVAFCFVAFRSGWNDSVNMEVQKKFSEDTIFYSTR